MGKDNTSGMDSSPGNNGTASHDTAPLDDAKDVAAVVKKTGSKKPKYIPPPDGGWGWVVVFSSFLIHVIADGVVYSFGVFLTELTDYFDAGRGPVSWVGSLQPAVTFTIGPIAAILTNRYGCRNVTIAGAIIAAAGFILSVFAPNLYYLMFTAGVMAGVGFGLIYLPAIVCVAQYFERRRSFATGLAVCGSGFGTMFLAPLTELLVMEYQWQGAMLILGGIILNIVICGIIFRPLDESDLKEGAEESEVGDKSEDKSEEERLLALEHTTSRSTEKKGDVIPSSPVKVVIEKDVDGFSNQNKGQGESKSFTQAEGLELLNTLQKQKILPKGVMALADGDAAMHNGSNGGSQTLTSSMNDKSSIPSDSDMFVMSEVERTKPDELCVDQPSITVQRMTASQHLHPSSSDQDYLASQVKSEGALHRLHCAQEGTTPPTTTTTVRHRTESPHHLAPLTRKDIFYSGSLQNIPMYRSNPELYKCTVTVVTDGGEGGEEEEEEVAQLGIWEEFRGTMSDMMSPELIQNPVFLMFAISNFFTSIGFNMPFIFLPDRAKLAGIDKESATFLVSIIGFANTAGRIVFGFLSDRPWVNRLFLYNTALTLCGIATALSAAIDDNYAMLAVYAAVFGVFIGVYVSLTSVVLVDLLGLDLLTNAFGVLLMFQGAATFVGPPIAGWLCDWTGSYDISFIVMGILIALSGSMLYALPFVQRRYNKGQSKSRVIRDTQLGKHVVG